ncbi:MAG: hypothetical protein HUK08_10010 [Bacteroidaceae bacterium]|nr:hypothetical protein [Bacteroidaceae bacterium]
MKKTLYSFIALFAAIALASCSKDPIGGTATQEYAGEWYVTCDAVDENDNVIPGYEDLFGLGRFNIVTYNSSANNTNELMVCDLGMFWDFRVKTALNPANYTFSAVDAQDYIDPDCLVDIEGAIYKNAGRQNNGSVADSICIYVSFSNDPYPDEYGYSRYKLSGVRYSGLVEND